MTAITTNSQHGAAMRRLAEVAEVVADMHRASETLGMPYQARLFWRLHMKLVGAHEMATDAFSRETHDHFKSEINAAMAAGRRP